MPRKKKNGGLRGKRKRKRPQFTDERKVILTSSTHNDHDDYTCEEGTGTCVEKIILTPTLVLS